MPNTGRIVACSAAQRNIIRHRFAILDRDMAKKLKNEKALLRKALEIVMTDAVKRGVVEFEPTDSHDLKIQFAYRLLVHDKEIAPLPRGQASLPRIKHRLAMWVTHKLPDDDELLR
jgi:hypothetical protein